MGRALAGTTGAGRALGEAGLAIGQTLSTLPLNAIAPGSSLVAMGITSAGQKMDDVKKQGGTSGEALLRGGVTGVIEGATEAIPLGTLFDLAKHGGTSAVKSVLKQAGIEAGEETAAYVLNYAADKLARDPNAAFSWSELAKAAAMGGFSGGIMGAGATAVYHANRSTGDSTGRFEKIPAEMEQILSSDNMARYKFAIDGVFTGILPSGTDIVVGKTPSILQQYGAPDLNLRIKQSTVRKIAYPEGYFKGKHNLGIPAVKELPYQLSDPVAILKSKTQPNSLVVIAEWKDTNGNDVIVPIHLNKQGVVEVSNEIASAYGTAHIETYLGKNGENILYIRNKEDIHQLLSNGLRLPEAMADDVLAKYSIR